MKNPRWANKKPKVKFLCNWQQFHEKINVVPQKKLFRKKCLLSAKISDDFLVKLQRAATNSLLLGRNHWKKMHFLAKYKKPKKNPRTQGLLKKSQKKAKVFVKKTYHKVGSKTQDLGRIPKEWQHW